MTKAPNKILETFPNPQPDRDYLIEIETPEFTCLCPKTGQPDFATLQLEYVPDKLCVELKSLKIYIWSYRDEGHFHEKVTNTILSDLVAATKPRYMRVQAQFNVRGGLYTCTPNIACPDGIRRRHRRKIFRAKNKMPVLPTWHPRRQRQRSRRSRKPNRNTKNR